MTTPLEHLSRNGRLDKFFIDGEWRAPRGTARGVVVNPATEAVVTRFPLGSGEDVDAAVSAARRAFAGFSSPFGGSLASVLAETRRLMAKLRCAPPASGEPGHGAGGGAATQSPPRQTGVSPPQSAVRQLPSTHSRRLSMSAHPFWPL